MQGHLFYDPVTDGDNRECLDRDGHPMEAKRVME